MAGVTPWRVLFCAVAMGAYVLVMHIATIHIPTKAVHRPHVQYAKEGSQKNDSMRAIENAKTYSQHLKHEMAANNTHVEKITLNSESDEDKLLKDSHVDTDVKLILMVAYMRTGSTLTGQLLQRSPGSFYVFEPIDGLMHTLNKHVNKKNTTSRKVTATVTLWNGTKRSYRSADDAVYDVLSSWFTCDANGVDYHSMVNKQHMIFNDSLAPFIRCFKGNKRSRKDSGCIDDGMRLCKRSNVRVFKVIRLSMIQAEKLLSRFPNMKIIYLMRDARGMFVSRRNAGLLTDNLTSEVVTHCKTNMEDIKAARRIMQTHPNTLHPIVYEELAETPIKVTRAIYQFVGLPFTKYIRTFIDSVTKSSRKMEQFSVYRNNSAAVAYAWRDSIAPARAVFIYNTCERVNQILGYTRLATAVALSNYSRPARTKLNTVHQLLNSPYVHK